MLGPDTKFKRESGSWGGILLNLLPIVLILVILFVMCRAQSGGARGADVYKRQEDKIADQGEGRFFTDGFLLAGLFLRIVEMFHDVFIDVYKRQIRDRAELSSGILTFH